MNMLTAA